MQARRRQIRTVGSREAEEAVAQARTRLEEAQRNASRIEILAAGGSVTKKMLDDARTALALAESAIRTATRSAPTWPAAVAHRASMRS